MARELIVDDDFVSRLGNLNDAPVISLCEEHNRELIQKLENRVELELTAFHVLTKIATSAIGTVNVARFGCPVCALMQFDYISELVPAITRGPKNGS